MAISNLTLGPFGEEFTQKAPGLSGIVIPKPKSMVQMEVARSFLYFILAGFCEIGGGYLIWLWLREGKNTWFALVGAVVLIIYGIIATLQPANFGRVYAAYGGIFIILAILWGWQIDKIAPDRFDLIGGLIALIGASVIMYWPRS